MDNDDFAISADDHEPDKFAYWQTRCLAAQVEIVNLVRRLLVADQQLIKQIRTITSQAERTVKLTQEVRTLHVDNPWLAVVRKHLNAATPTELDSELEALNLWYRDKKDENDALTRRIAEQAAQLSEYQDADHTPLT